METKFITLEGIEGSGKTSSIKSITDLLDRKRISLSRRSDPPHHREKKEVPAPHHVCKCGTGPGAHRMSARCSPRQAGSCIRQRRNP